MGYRTTQQARKATAAEQKSMRIKKQEQQDMMRGYSTPKPKKGTGGWAPAGKRGW